MKIKWGNTLKVLYLPRPGVLWWLLFMLVLMLLFTLDLCTALYSLQSPFVDVILFGPTG